MKISTLSAFLLFSIVASNALAQEKLVFMAGINNIGYSEDNIQIGAEYRGNGFFAEHLPRGELLLTFGATVDSESATYIYGGISWDIPMTNRWYLTPAVMVGAYSQGAGRYLGGTLEFRPGVEVSYLLNNNARLGLNLNHKSNAATHRFNPGTESLLVTYSMPMNIFSGK